MSPRPNGGSGYYATPELPHDLAKADSHMGEHGLGRPSGVGWEDNSCAGIANLPTETGGTEITRFNALKHGILSRHTVLPWEDAGEYRALVAALAAEHSPQGPTEEHLVEELAGILWRKRRLRLAEAAAHHHALHDATEPYRGTVNAALVHLNHAQKIEGVVDAIRATPEETAQETRDLSKDEAMTAKALKLLHDGATGAYERAVAALHADTREWWENILDRDPDDFDEDEEPATPDAEGLRQFIEIGLRPWYAQRRKKLQNQALIRDQAFGQSFDTDKLERLGRYEVHLDRKLERMLTMLVRLQDLRLGSDEA